MLNEIKNERCFYIICAGIIMLCIALICFFSYTKEDKYADSIEDLKVKISYDTTKESVNIWKSDEGTYYCFLPSGALKNKLNFSGVSKNAVLKFDSVAIDKKTDLSQIENLINDKHTLEINYGGQIQKIDLVFLCSSNLQTVFIDTDKVDLEVLCESKDNFDSAQMRIYSDSEKKLSSKIDKIHCRGASSFTTADKKSFSFKTNEEEKLLGMKSSQKWCLIANRFDSSFMHNKLAYDYFREYTDIPSSESSYVDLYINGEYEGNYLLCHNAGDIVEIEKSYDLEEKIKSVNTQGKIKNAQIIEKGAIKAYDGIEDPNDITGTYVIETRTERDGFDVGFISEYGNAYEVVCPEHPSVKQVEYICNYVNEFEKALYSEDGINPDTGKTYSEYLDIDSWTKKYVMDQLFGDMDKNLYNKSIFYYKYPDSVDSHLFTGPAWDYDCSMGEGIPLATLNTPALPVFDNSWSKELSKKEEVKSRIKEHFPMLSSQYVDNDLSNKVDELTIELSDSVLMDSIRWKSLARYTSLNKEGEYIVWYMKQRKDLLMDIWSNEEIYHTVTFLGPSKEVCGMYMIKHGDRLERVPDVFSWTDIFSGWESDEYDEVKRGIIVKNDMVIRSKWLSIETIVSNNYDDLDADLSRVDIDSLKKIKNSIQKKRNN